MKGTNFELVPITIENEYIKIKIMKLNFKNYIKHIHEPIPTIYLFYSYE